MKKQSATRYGLVTWPESQDCIGRPECILILPPESDVNGSLDSAYLVPLTEEDLKHTEGYVRVDSPESQRYEHLSEESYTPECYRDYNGNIFVREDLIKND